jgi:class 3 adenylate cyclase
VTANDAGRDRAPDAGATAPTPTPGQDPLQERFAALPRWRRPRRLRRQLARTLVGTALLSVLLVGGVNFVAARALLDRGTQEQLVGTGETRALSIERGVGRALDIVGAVAADLAVVRALEELGDAFGDAGVLDDEQLAELDEFYETEVVEPLRDLGLADVTTEEAEPDSGAGKYLQYHYTYAPGVPREERSAVDDAGDGSEYSAVHATWHPYLRSLLEIMPFGDLLLIDYESGDIVYSVEKRIDFGTDISSGPYRNSELASTVIDGLATVRVGESVLSDFQIFIPGGGRPVAFVASAVRSDTELIGAVAMQITIEQLNEITTAGGQWEAVGLGSGESYVVGSDGLLRSESRLWIEDPDRYLEKVDDEELAELISALGSPVLLQPVETKPLEVVLDGEDFQGTATNYLGTDTYAFATTIDVPGVDWIVVAEVPLDDARSPLFDYLWRMLIVIAILLPIAALVGAWLARRSARPVAPVVAAATAVAEGDRDPELPELGRDEFGDLGRRLHQMANDLGRQEQVLEAEYERTRQLLLSVLPPRLVAEDGMVRDTGEAAEFATAISVVIDVDAGQETEDVLDEVLSREASLLDELAEGFGIDRVRAAADRSLFVAGIGRPEAGADEALQFVIDAHERIAALNEDEAVTVRLQVGISSGPIGVGVLERGSVSFGAWGEPVRRALAITALAEPDETLVDATTFVEATEGRFELDSADELVGLDGEPMGLHRLVLSGG